MKTKPIFSDNFLTHYLPGFKASSITDIRGITILIKSLIDELESGKLESLKEEEIKSRFVTTFFGDILGFNYGNSNKWQLREEVKSTVDGKKPDAALGYFFIDKEKDDVRAVIEIKNAKTNLDKKQNRDNNQTPVEQAFSYASKMGGNCKWVIISNIKETRFYLSNDSSKCQIFFLSDLIKESKRNELLFLFHKNRFIIEFGNSATDILLRKATIIQAKNDSPIHIIDKLYNFTKRFEGLGFVDPDFIANIYPFNILDDHVWHYHNRNLLTINGEFYQLLKRVKIDNNEVIFLDELKAEIESFKVVDAKFKIETSFKFLNQCLIDEISAIEDYEQIEQKHNRISGFRYRNHFHFKEGDDGITKRINIHDNNVCDCLICNYRSLDFNRLLRKLKTSLGNDSNHTLEYAFANYLVATNNYKTTYNIYQAIEKGLKDKEGKEIEYFLTKQNIKYLHNLISDYQYDDNEEILSKIKSIDLDKVIYDEIEYSVDKDVKEYLIKVKEEAFIFKLQDRIEENIFEIEKLKQLYDRGGKQYSGPDLPNKLFQTFLFLYSHINMNYIIYDTFTRYKSLVEKSFKGFVTSYLTPEVGLKSFHEFILTETILHVSPNALKEILINVDDLKTDVECVDNILQKTLNLTSSYFIDGLFNKPYRNSLLEEQLINFRFQIRFTDIFTNLFTILSRLNITKEQFNKPKKAILKFLELENELAWYNIEALGNFIKKKGHLFTAEELVEILKISINGSEYGNNKYTTFIKLIADSLVKFYPKYKVHNSKLIETAILKCSSDDGENASYNDLICLLSICDDGRKTILTNLFEKYLDNKFDSCLYESLLRSNSYSYKTKNYFKLYCEHINQSSGKTNGLGELKLTSFAFINFILIVYKLNVDINRSEFKLFKKLNDFESWLLDPFNYNYENFDTQWLVEIKEYIILGKIKGITQIGLAIENELKKGYNSDLAEIKYKYFNS